MQPYHLDSFIGPIDLLMVRKSLALSDRKCRRILLFDWEKFKDGSKIGEKRRRNLACVSADGRVEWWAELPAQTEVDMYVDVDVTAKNEIVANTWSACRVTLDPETGKITSSRFTK